MTEKGDWNPLTTTDVEIVMADSGGDPRLTGLVLVPGGGILGVLPNTPASDIGIEKCAQITGFKIDHGRRAEIEERKAAAAFVADLMKGPVPKQ